MLRYAAISSLLYAIIIVCATSEGAPINNSQSPPPIRCVGMKPASVCDSSGLFTQREIYRILRAAKKLARLKCGEVMIIIGARQTPLESATYCMLKIHDNDVSIIGRRIFTPSQRALYQRRIIARINSGWTIANALIEALNSLSITAPNTHPKHRWIVCFIFVILVYTFCRGCINATFLRPHYERCRRVLKRLDDVRAKTKALKFKSNVCPICLDFLPPSNSVTMPISQPSPIPPLPPLTSTIYSNRPTNVNMRRSRVSLSDDSNSHFSFDSSSNSSNSTDDDSGSKRRTLPCGHGKFLSHSPHSIFF